MANLNALVEDFIGRAEASPDPTPVLREAANKFAHWAMAPENAQMSKRLNDVAMGFAQAARKPRQARRATQEIHEIRDEETKDAINEVGDHNVLNITARRNEIHEARTSDAPRVSISPESFNASAT